MSAPLDLTAAACTLDGSSGSDAAPSANASVLPVSGGDRAILALSDGWRVAHDGRLQWILQRLKGRQWHGRRFHTERSALLRSIGQLCGEVDPAALVTIEAWPATYAEFLALHGQRIAGNAVASLSQRREAA